MVEICFFFFLGIYGGDFNDGNVTKDNPSSRYNMNGYHLYFKASLSLSYSKIK